MSESDPLLAVNDLRTHIRTDEGIVRAVDGVDFSMSPGETVCLVGESGSGKSALCESLTGIIPQPPARIESGSVNLNGTDVLSLRPAERRAVRGNRIAHVFQNPQASLDPVASVGRQIVETIRTHEDISRDEARHRAIDLLHQVNLPAPRDRFDDYPHQLSGGMRQRVAIAIALAADPEVLIADEPTTAVDVTVQARLIDLLRGLTDGGMGLLLVTHDLRVAAALADRLLVMYGGTIVERGPVERVYSHPAHPYTQSLLEYSQGAPTTRIETVSRNRIPGDGCRFREECPHAVDPCAAGPQPEFERVEADTAHQVSCVFYRTGWDEEAIAEAARRARAISPEGQP